MVVDDSATVRQALAAILGREGMEVTVAADPVFALGRMAAARPEVLVLDLEMPRMHGLTFLRRLMAEEPLPVVVCSAVAGPGSHAALQALEEGAVEVVGKPRLGVRDFLFESSTLISDAVRAAAAARLRPARAPRARAPREASFAPAAARRSRDLVAIGASTGGTAALSAILPAFPADAPATVVVQHMPAGFTAAFARRLDEACAVEVHEARDGERLAAGLVLIAPGGRHLRVESAGGALVARVEDGPLVGRHRPSVDVLFHSVAEARGRRAVGVLLTGMGVDGAAGLLELRREGAATLAQDEASCVVFGMPREAIDKGAAGRVVPLERMAEAILDAAAGTPPPIGVTT
jgi:two-component system chemotaxis response regulator CheB